MLIQRIHSLPKGTIVTFPGGFSYHFLPREPGGPHVADVENQRHIDRFLAMPEGYRAVEPPAPAQPTVPVQAPELAAALASADIPAGDALHAPEPQDDDIAAAEDADADTDEGAADLSGEDDQQPDDQTDAGKAVEDPAQPEAGTPADLPDFTAMSDDQLRAEFEASVGRKPSSRAGRATMIAQITAALSGE